MTVECPGCNTSFPVDPDKVPEGGVYARCSVCQEVFLVQVAEAEVEPAMAPAEPEAPDLPSLEEEETAFGEDAAAIGEEEPLPDFEAAEPEPSEEGPLPTLEAEEEPLPTLEAEEEPEPLEEEPLPAFEAPEPEPSQEDEGPVFGSATIDEATLGAAEEEEEGALDAEPVFEAEPAMDPSETTFGADVVVDEPGTTMEDTVSGFETEPEPVADEPAVDTGDALGADAVGGMDAPVVEEPTFGDGETTFSMDAPALEEPTFGDGETTFSMDGTDLAAEAPTFDSATPELPEVDSFSEGLAPEEPTGEETAGEEATLESETPEVTSFEAPAVEDMAVPAPEEEPAPEPPAQEAVAEPEVAAPLPTPSFGKRDPKDKAQRLARVLVSDIILYNPDRHQKALDGGTLKEDFQEEIEKSWSEYVEQVGEEIANGTDFFNEALNDILAKGQEIF